VAEQPKNAVVPMDIEWQGAWLSWVGSTTMCLKALGEDCDLVDVAGHSSYAFALSINDGMCPSGPTMLEWSSLATGVFTALGRTTETFISCDCFIGEFRNDRTRAHARQAFEMAARETEAGRPCVVWGLGVPEFGVVRGIEGDEYLGVAGGCTPERQKWDTIEAPGGPCVFAFPTPNQKQEDRDRYAVLRAVRMMTRLPWSPKLAFGLPAYDAWIGHLGSKKANAWGNSYNTQCWAEARQQARDFIGRLAERNPAVSEPLGKAHEAYCKVAEAMTAVAEIFPFSMEPGEVEDAAMIETAVDHLRKAKAAEAGALEAMIGALTDWMN
jgi:hypothetical protein